MKLVDILARELKVWPEGFPRKLGQASDGSLHHCDKYGRALAGNYTKQKFTICDSYPSEVVKRKEWQAAIDALKAEKVVEWNGEGLPPVGIDVEVFADYSHPRFDRFIGRQVHIVAHDVINGDPVAVFRMPIDGDDTEQDFHAMGAKSFRPIRTPEQIAEEEIQRIRDEIKWQKPKLGPCPVEQMYLLGYRKSEIVDN